MNARMAGAAVVCAAVLGMSLSSAAQGKQVTVEFLRAAASSLEDGERVSLTGEYSAAEGLEDARGSYLRNKGFSRFSISDGSVSFDNVYCAYDSKAFAELIKVKGRRRFVFSGYKQRAQRQEHAVFVTDVQALPEKDQPEESTAASRVYRLTLLDHASSNVTIVGNIEIGKPVRVLGNTLILDEEPVTGGGVLVLPPPAP